MWRHGLALLATLVTPALAQAPPRRLELTLGEAEARALRVSNDLKAYGADVDSASESARAQYAALFPRLTLDANYRYIAKIPAVTVAGPGQPFSFGANNNYSVGPTLSYTL